MAWSAPYTNSLVPETETANVVVQASNPFTSSETHQANAIMDTKSLSRQETNAENQNSYVPPDAIFASTWSAPRGNVDDADSQQIYHHSHAGVTSIASQENDTAAYEGEESTFGMHHPSRLTSDHPAKERPQTLLTDLKDAERKPKKSILKTNESSSIRLSTACAVQMSRTSGLATGSPECCSSGRDIERVSSGIVACQTDIR